MDAAAMGTGTATGDAAGRAPDAACGPVRRRLAGRHEDLHPQGRRRHHRACSTAAGCRKDCAAAHRLRRRSTRPRPPSAWPGPTPARGRARRAARRARARPVGADGRAGHRRRATATSSPPGATLVDRGDGRRASRRSSTTCRAGSSRPRSSSCPARTVLSRPARRGPHRGAPGRARRRWPRPRAGSLVVPYLNRLSDLLWTLARWQEGASLATRSVPAPGPPIATGG